MLCGTNSPRRRNKIKAILITIFIVYVLYFLFFANTGSARPNPSNHAKDDAALRHHWHSSPGHGATTSRRIQKDMVVASMKSDNTSWLFEHFPDWHKSIYVVDEAMAELTVKLNKGRESMVYLTYIIDNYDHLPSFMLFIHSQRYQWHNDDPYYDGVPMIRNFQLPYLEEQGYVNLRCAWTLGCPAEIHPFEDTHRQDVHAGEYFKTGFMELFPGVEVPQEVGVSCCAQFAVTREKVWERPKADYERVRKWLAATELPDDLSGRIMEYSWHMIFGKDPVHCPTAEECYCNVFGLCHLTCQEEGACAGRYVLPPYSTLPQGWPYIGWDGQQQDPTKELPA